MSCIDASSELLMRGRGGEIMESEEVAQHQKSTTAAAIQRGIAASMQGTLNRHRTYYVDIYRQLRSVCRTVRGWLSRKRPTPKITVRVCLRSLSLSQPGVHSKYSKITETFGNLNISYMLFKFQLIKHADNCL